VRIVIILDMAEKEMGQFRISDENRESLDKLRVGRYSALSLTAMGDMALRVGVETLQREDALRTGAAAAALTAALAVEAAPKARRVHLDVGVRAPAAAVPVTRAVAAAVEPEVAAAHAARGDIAVGPEEARSLGPPTGQ